MSDLVERLRERLRAFLLNNDGMKTVTLRKGPDDMVLFNTWAADLVEDGDKQRAHIETLQAELAEVRAKVERAREALGRIAVVEQGCGGNLSFKQMAESAMRQARTALKEIEP